MALRGVKPRSIEKRLKAFFYGAAKVGKTTAAIQFPKPYLIDTEKGAENEKYVKVIEERGGLVFQSNQFEEVMEEIRSLLTLKHEYKTLIIDPMTTLYDDLVMSCANEVGEDYGKHIGLAGRKMKNMYSLLLRLDMNVIITSHAKPEYKMIGKELTLLGNTFDCYKKMDYMFDLILEIQKRGKERVAVIKGSRLEEFNEDEVFPFNYDEICNRYGKEILERDCVSVELATPDQIKELQRLISLLHIEQSEVDKMLKKEEVESFEYMSNEYIQKCIGYFATKIQGEVA
jgi:AAA domain